MTTSELWEGMGHVPVIDSDGKELGTYGGVRNEYLKVEAPHARDYWIPQDIIASANSSEVRLKVNHAEVEKRRNLDEGEGLTDTEIEEGTDNLGQPVPMERRYANEAEYLSRPRQL